MPAARRFRTLLRLAPGPLAVVAIMSLGVAAKAQTVISTIRTLGVPMQSG